jgi:signal transduction histidine kinase
LRLVLPSTSGKTKLTQREEALQALSDDSAMRRLRAARALFDVATVADRAAIAAQLAREEDSWTQRALERVLARTRDGAVFTQSTQADPDEHDLEGVQAQALQLATKQVLHEVRPAIQAVETANRLNLGEDFAGSATEAALTRLTELLAALQQLGDAASAPRIQQFDLTEIITSLLSTVESGPVTVTVARTDAVLVAGDSALISLALSNLVRNALEASREGDGSVIVNWARREGEAWISVLDNGVGLPEDALSAATEVGTTTKGEQGHFGLGLPISLRAIESLSGRVILAPRKQGGTAAEIRWPQ